MISDALIRLDAADPPTRKTNQVTREVIENQVAEFLNSGGEIKKIPENFAINPGAVFVPDGRNTRP